MWQPATVIARIALVLAWCGLVAVAAVNLPHLTFDNDTWLGADNPRRVELDQFRAEFEPHEVLLVVLELPLHFFADSAPAAALRAHIREVESALVALPQVNSVLSPLSATTIIDRGESLAIGSFADALQNGWLADVNAYRIRFLHSPYAGKLLSADARTALLRVAINRGDANSRAVAMRDIKSTIARVDFSAGVVVSDISSTTATAATKVHFAGESALKNQLNLATRSQLLPLLALAALMLALFLYFACGAARGFVLLATAAATVAACLGVVAALGFPINAVLLALPVLVAVITVADGLHIFATWDALSADHTATSATTQTPPERNRTRLRQTIRQTWQPCLGASVTSAVGFGAFALSELVPLQHFGIAAAIAILYAYPLIIGALWGGLWLSKNLQSASSHSRINWAHLSKSAAHLTYTRPISVICTAIVIAALLAAGLSLVRVNTNFLTVFFSDDSPLAQSFAVVDTKLGGSNRVEVVLRGSEEAFAEVANMQRLDALTRQFHRIDSVNQVDSYLLPIAMSEQAFGGDHQAKPSTARLPATSSTGEALAPPHLPQTDAALAQHLLFLSLSHAENTRDVLSPYLDFNHSSARLSLQTPDLDSQQLRTTIAQVAAVINQESAANPTTKTTNLSLTITGFGVFIHHLSEHVLTTQAVSIATTLAVIAMLLIAQFGIRLGLCGFAANLLPLAATAGLISWLGFPYDFATILIAGITLGLSVDDTIHFLHHYQRQVGVGDNQAAATDQSTRAAAALARTTRPIILTTALFAAGLAVIMFSDLVVLQRFAAFTICGLIAAGFAVLLFLPALLAVTSVAMSPRKPKSGNYQIT